jgi:hypothetical protein
MFLLPGMQFALVSPGSPSLTYLLVDPLGGRLDLRSRLVPSIFSPAARQTAYSANCHVFIANDLTAQPDARQAPRRKYVTLSDSHAVGLAVEEFDAARRAACLPATGVQLIDCRILLKSQDQPLT